MLSPSLLEKVSYVGTLLKSFRQGDVAIEKLLDISLGHKRLERITERIGAERLVEADQEVAAFEALTLMEKLAGPKNVRSPVSAAVMADGGRYQRCEKNESEDGDRRTHWFEDKAGLCLELGGRRDDVAASSDAVDPCPQVPGFLMNVEQIETLTREIGQKATEKTTLSEADASSINALHAANTDTPVDTNDDGQINLHDAQTLSDLERIVVAAQQSSSHRQAAADSVDDLPMSPKVITRDVVATLENSRHLGLKLAAHAWSLGLFQATFKAFVGDGSSWIWTIFDKHFRPFKFIAVLDIIHAVTYVYAAAMAGRTDKNGTLIYHQWVSWLWSGEVSQVITALAKRQSELGVPTDEDGPTSPRQIVSGALTYLQNQQSRMNYPLYRKLGLPITSSHMESAIKELNFRMKGTEKFWSKQGGQSVIQLRADNLSDTDPLSIFWKERAKNRTGLRRCVGIQKAAALPSAT